MLRQWGAAPGGAVTFRSRVQLAFVALAVVSIGGLALGVRGAMTRRLTGEYPPPRTADVGATPAGPAGRGAALARAAAARAQLCWGARPAAGPPAARMEMR